MPAGVSAYVPLANLTLSTTVATVTFSSISQSYRDLILVTNVAGSGGAQNITLINGDSGSNYNSVYMEGNGSSASSSSETNASRIVGITLAGTNPMVSITQFLDYSATDKHKTILRRIDKSDTSTIAVAGRWANTAAITSFTLGPAGVWTAGSTFALYGVSA
jgi:hypothetical protein